MNDILFWIFIAILLLIDIGPLRGNFRDASSNAYNNVIPISEKDNYDKKRISRVYGVYFLIFIITLVILYLLARFNWLKINLNTVILYLLRKYTSFKIDPNIFFIMYIFVFVFSFPVSLRKFGRKKKK